LGNKTESMSETIMDFSMSVNPPIVSPGIDRKVNRCTEERIDTKIEKIFFCRRATGGRNEVNDEGEEKGSGHGATISESAEEGQRDYAG